MKFSTEDGDNDIMDGNCAANYHAAWWYTSCYISNLNGYFNYSRRSDMGIIWLPADKSYRRVKNSMMMIRRF